MCPFPRNLSFCDWHKHARWLYGIRSRFEFLLRPPRELLETHSCLFYFIFFPFVVKGLPWLWEAQPCGRRPSQHPARPSGPPGCGRSRGRRRSLCRRWVTVQPRHSQRAAAPSLALCSFSLLASPSHSCFFSSPFSPPSNLNARKVTTSGQGVRLPARPFWRRLPAVTAVPVRLFGIKPR